MWIHQPPKGQEDRAVDLIVKDIEEFQSGRRCFVFTTHKKPVPAENYKIVMLYIIRALKEDRAAFYQEHPLNENEYETCVAKIKENGLDLSLDQYYVFEWVSRQLISLEDEINKAESDKQIEMILKKFYGHYKRLPNVDMDLTVSSCIDPDVLSFSASHKPLIYFGVPLSLIELANGAGIMEKFPKDIILEDLASLSSNQDVGYHPPAVQETFDQLKELYDRLINEDGKEEILSIDLKDEMRKFYTLWKTIPQRGLLIKYGPFNNFFKFIQALEEQLGISQQQLEQLLKRKRWANFFDLEEAFNEIVKKHPCVFETSSFDPKKTYEDLKNLKVDLDGIKQKYVKEIKEQNHWMIDFSEELDKILEEKIPEYDPYILGRCRFERLKGLQVKASFSLFQILTKKLKLLFVLYR
jgi:hypothetical protein